MRYRDRIDAGQQLAEKLMMYANRPDVLVLALPRGGVPVGFAVAEVLHAPLDVFLVRKLGVPGHEELAMGAIASGGVRVLNEEVVNFLQIRLALPCALLSWHCVNSSQPGLSLLFLLLPVPCVMSWKLWQTRLGVQRHQNRSMPLACGTRTLSKSAMQRSATCLHRQRTGEPPWHIQDKKEVESHAKGDPQ